MADTFNVTAAYDKTTYNQGDKITVTISGGDVSTVAITSKVGPIAIPIIAANGATTTINIPAENVSVVTATPQSVVIDISKPIIDTSATPRLWAVAANRLSISATA